MKNNLKIVEEVKAISIEEMASELISLTNQIKPLEERITFLKDALKNSGQTKIETEKGTVSVTKSEIIKLIKSDSEIIDTMGKQFDLCFKRIVKLDDSKFLKKLAEKDAKIASLFLKQEQKRISIK